MAFDQIQIYYTDLKVLENTVSVVVFVYANSRLTIKRVHIFICELTNNLPGSTVFRCIVGHTYPLTKFVMYYAWGGSTYEGLKYA